MQQPAECSQAAAGYCRGRTRSETEIVLPDWRLVQKYKLRKPNDKLTKALSPLCLASWGKECSYSSAAIVLVLFPQIDFLSKKDLKFISVPSVPHWFAYWPAMESLTVSLVCAETTPRSNNNDNEDNDKLSHNVLLLLSLLLPPPGSICLISLFTVHVKSCRRLDECRLSGCEM